MEACDGEVAVEVMVVWCMLSRQHHYFLNLNNSIFLTELMNKKHDTNYPISISRVKLRDAALLVRNIEAKKWLLFAENTERLCLILTTGLEMWPFKSDTSDGCHSYH